MPLKICSVECIGQMLLNRRKEWIGCLRTHMHDNICTITGSRVAKMFFKERQQQSFHSTTKNTSVPVSWPSMMRSQFSIFTSSVGNFHWNSGLNDVVVQTYYSSREVIDHHLRFQFISFPFIWILYMRVLMISEANRRFHVWISMQLWN
jgi:hypothetical protein